MPKDIYNLNNLIIYGPKGVGKYSQALNCIKGYSPSNLKYERKMQVKHGNHNYNFKLSDIHFEVDMSILGCNAKSLWNVIYEQIIDILSLRSHRVGIILCTNFHEIHNELLTIFYSYMQLLLNNNVFLVFILTTEHTSFIPFNIMNQCTIFSVKRPTKMLYGRCVSRLIGKNIKLCNITNIKDLYNKTFEVKVYNVISDKIIEHIVNYKNIDFITFRDDIYNLFIYNKNIQECIFYILNYFVTKNLLDNEKMEKIIKKLFISLKYYNNNYRPIYHIENLILYICKVIYEF